MTVDELIASLGLAPHPEGGWYVETFRSPVIVATPRGPRPASTAIYFLLPAGSFSALHRVTADEVWHHYRGDPLELVVLGGATTLLGPERPQAVVPAGAWQAARPLAGAHGFTLCGCTVAPGFSFDDFELGERAALLAAFPGDAARVRAFTRDPR